MDLSTGDAIPITFYKEMKTISTSPSPEDSFAVGRQTHRLGQGLAVCGILLYSGPFWGLLGTVFAMIRAFNEMSGQGTANPSAISEHVHLALITTSIGFAAGIVGSIIISLTIVFTEYRRQWFYSWAIGLSVLWCIAAFPLSLIPGLLTINFFSSRRSEFNKLGFKPEVRGTN
ncbi:MAG: MotA/TolQ/ExbB proton channel family protein [Luteolibacter sp.]